MGRQPGRRQSHPYQAQPAAVPEGTECRPGTLTDGAEPKALREHGFCLGTIRSHRAGATWRGRDNRQRFRLRHFGFNPMIAVSPCRISADNLIRVFGRGCVDILRPNCRACPWCRPAVREAGPRPPSNAAAHREPALKRPIRRPDRPAPLVLWRARWLHAAHPANTDDDRHRYRGGNRRAPPHRHRSCDRITT